MSWAKNEPTAASRRCLLHIADDGGVLVSPGADPIGDGAVFVVGVNAPDADLATGTCTNVRRALVVADDTFTAASDDICTAVAHGLQTGDGPIRLTTSAADLPLNLLTATDYWIIKLDADTFNLASSLANAYAGTAVDIADAGTGTHTLSDTADTERGLWGHFVYEASQAETNHDASFTYVIVDGTVDGNSCLRMNAGGANTQVEMTSHIQSIWEVPGEDGHTYGDLMRAMVSVLLARMLVSGTGYTLRDLADTKNRIIGTITASGRDPATVVDLT